jgi:hypothetical protein
VTISAALVFVIIAIILVRSGRSTITTALVCVLAGFLLASTGLAPTINNFLTSTGIALSRMI